MSMVKRPVPAEIPTSSMADIAFLLIVFFMMTTVFSANKGMDHVLPPSKEGAEPDPAVFLKIFPGDSFEIDGNQYPLSEVDRIFAYLNERLQRNPNKPVILYTDREAPYGHMVAVMDQLKLVEHKLNHPVALTIPTRAEAEQYRDYH